MNHLMKTLYVLLINVFSLSALTTSATPIDTLNQDQNKDMELIFAAIERYNEAWRTRDVSLAIQDYSGSIHWVNSVGDVLYTKKSLEEYLSRLFTIDAVMDAQRLPQSDQITFLSAEIGVVHSMHMESGVKSYHLRVFSKQGDEWKIINHLESRVHPKE